MRTSADVSASSSGSAAPASKRKAGGPSSRVSQALLRAAVPSPPLAPRRAASSAKSPRTAPPTADPVKEKQDVAEELVSLGCIQEEDENASASSGTCIGEPLHEESGAHGVAEPLDETLLRLQKKVSSMLEAQRQRGSGLAQLLSPGSCLDRPDTKPPPEEPVDWRQAETEGWRSPLPAPRLPEPPQRGPGPGGYSVSGDVIVQQHSFDEHLYHQRYSVDQAHQQPLNEYHHRHQPYDPSSDHQRILESGLTTPTQPDMSHYYERLRQLHQEGQREKQHEERPTPGGLTAERLQQLQEEQRWERHEERQANVAQEQHHPEVQAQACPTREQQDTSASANRQAATMRRRLEQQLKRSEQRRRDLELENQVLHATIKGSIAREAHDRDSRGGVPASRLRRVRTQPTLATAGNSSPSSPSQSRAASPWQRQAKPCSPPPPSPAIDIHRVPNAARGGAKFQHCGLARDARDARANVQGAPRRLGKSPSRSGMHVPGNSDVRGADEDSRATDHASSAARLPNPANQFIAPSRGVTSSLLQPSRYDLASRPEEGTGQQLFRLHSVMEPATADAANGKVVQSPRERLQGRSPSSHAQLHTPAPAPNGRQNNGWVSSTPKTPAWADSDWQRQPTPEPPAVSHDAEFTFNDESFPLHRHPWEESEPHHRSSFVLAEQPPSRPRIGPGRGLVWPSLDVQASEDSASASTHGVTHQPIPAAVFTFEGPPLSPWAEDGRGGGTSGQAAVSAIAASKVLNDLKSEMRRRHITVDDLQRRGDRDRNDLLTLGELGDIFASVNIQIDEGTLHQVFKEMDKDGSGRIDFPEFMAALDKGHQATQDAGKAAAAVAGRILGQAASDAGDNPEQVSSGVYQGDQFDRIDMNHNGFISREEWDKYAAGVLGPGVAMGVGAWTAEPVTARAAAAMKAALAGAKAAGIAAGEAAADSGHPPSKAAEVASKAAAKVAKGLGLPPHQAVAAARTQSPQARPQERVGTNRRALASTQRSAADSRPAPKRHGSPLRAKETSGGKDGRATSPLRQGNARPQANRSLSPQVCPSRSPMRAATKQQRQEAAGPVLRKRG
eukprot:TRINITY_DN3043_c2_g1_i1.p1 TRINITY_DN3043_c2_g1~~TRINITY_DN3043_c2_g1_i1.p1  ORF type:complete len:1070 (+),score=236.20 TRINITY_DN3043_c2_g1_i1:125-3334(+)